MNNVVTPFCLLLSLGMFIAAIAIVSGDNPQPSLELHRATAAGDDDFRKVLEEDLHRRQRGRTIFVVSLFAIGALLAVTSLFIMRPSPPAKN